MPNNSNYSGLSKYISSSRNSSPSSCGSPQPKPKSKTAINCSPRNYASTRSAAMMALTLRTQPSQAVQPPICLRSSSVESSFINNAHERTHQRAANVLLQTSSSKDDKMDSLTMMANGSNGADHYAIHAVSSTTLSPPTPPTATALRRLYFKSGRNFKNKPSSKLPSIFTTKRSNGNNASSNICQTSLGEEGPTNTTNAISSIGSFQKVSFELL